MSMEMLGLKVELL